MVWFRRVLDQTILFFHVAFAFDQWLEILSIARRRTKRGPEHARMIGEARELAGHSNPH
jgi:hypothetical protein